MSIKRFHSFCSFKNALSKFARFNLALLIAFSWTGLELKADSPAQASAAKNLSLIWSSYDSDFSRSIAWGDIDQDGDLDLAIGNYSQPLQLYHNHQGVLETVASWSSGDMLDVRQIVWGDLDNDKDLDLVTATSERERYYLNTRGVLSSTSDWASTYSDGTNGIALGDVDGDGDLDLAVGNSNTALDRLYRNDQGAFEPDLTWNPALDLTRAVAWGDVDGDGDLDLATANDGFEKIFLNTGGSLSSTPAWSSTETANGDYSYALAWGDVDNDGDLDLVVGNGDLNQTPAELGTVKLYRNLRNGSNTLNLTTSSVWTPLEVDDCRTVAWGDYDGDGDLDLATGNYRQPNRLYLNTDGTLSSSAVWSSPEWDATSSVIWGDLDSDGDLDLAAGNNGPERLYRNDHGVIETSADWSSAQTNNVSGIAWGDYDNDGDMDLVVGTERQYIHLYKNEDGALLNSAFWSSSELESTRGLAWGDVDGDGDLDLAVANFGQANRLYRNDEGQLVSDWVSDEIDHSWSVAWGDYDNDGDLDLAVGNFNALEPNRLYRNDGGVLSTTAVWSSHELSNTRIVIWGDYDNDGDLDLATGSHGSYVYLYRNENGVLSTTATWKSYRTDNTTSMDWSDIDGDGDLDLAVGNNFTPLRVYNNEGGVLSSAAVWSSIESTSTSSISFGDYDNDGDQDLATASFGTEMLGGQPNYLYRNEKGVLTNAADWISDESDSTLSVAWGDVDNDGDLDLAAGNGGRAGETARPIRVYTNLRDRSNAMGALPVIDIVEPGLYANGYSDPHIWEGPTVPIQFVLSGPPDSLVKVTGEYALNGSGLWKPALPSSDTLVTHLQPGTHTFDWDLFASGFYGKSDQVVLRLKIIPEVVNRVNSTPGPYLYSSNAAQTLPLRVRGTQVQVVDVSGAPVHGARIYRQGRNDSQAELITDLSGSIYSTDIRGYLQGYGEIEVGDRLAALRKVDSADLPCPADTCELFYTSAAPTTSDLDWIPVEKDGVQVLTISANHPLVVYNLSVSLEWDARGDTAFMQQLNYHLQRVSGLLYDWTNGQAALGTVKIYHDQGHWNDAHIRIYASNRRRPTAAQGGMIVEDFVDPDASALVYQPGMVHMGKVWNRYGRPGFDLGDDWPRALAHELGHYLFFLDDNYVGVNDQGVIHSLETCTKSAMTDPYRDDYSEFRRAEDWLPACQDTLSNRTTQRSDWATIEKFYPSLDGSTLNPGPILLALALYDPEEIAPADPPLALNDPRFYIKNENNASLEPGGNARAFLFRNGLQAQQNRLVDLGGLVNDTVVAPGAQPGDRLCVIALNAHRTGCKTVVEDDNQELVLAEQPNWQPAVSIAPQSPNSVYLQVNDVQPGLTLKTQLYSGDGLASGIFTLNEQNGVYSTTLGLTDSTVDGYIRVWVEEANPQREVVTDYSMGGSPARKRSGFARKRSGFAPVMSSDGQVILYDNSLAFPLDEFYTLQVATVIPPSPPWATQVGLAYWLTSSDGAPSLAGTYFSISYLESEVPPGEEAWLQLYHWNEETAQWMPLVTHLDQEANAAIGIVSGPGLYTLMSSITVDLYGPGWDQFAYPVKVDPARSVEDALQSIDGYYETLYWYDGNHSTNPWKVYDVDVPVWVNDLQDMRFGESYWILLNQDISLRLKGAEGVSTAGSSVEMRLPTTFYGRVVGDEAWQPTAGMEISAWVDGVKCGSGEIFEVDHQLVYTIDVFSANLSAQGCNTARAQVTFVVQNHSLKTTAILGEPGVSVLDLGMLYTVYLPAITQFKPAP